MTRKLTNVTVWSPDEREDRDWFVAHLEWDDGSDESVELPADIATTDHISTAIGEFLREYVPTRTAA